MKHIEIIEPNIIVEIPVKNAPEETPEQTLRDVLLKLSQIKCYDNKENFTYDEIKAILNSKLKQIEQRRKNKNDDI